VSANYLTNDLVVTSPSDYEVSLTSGSGYGSSVTITPTSGTVSSSCIYVRLKAGLSTASYNGELITISYQQEPHHRHLH
jgi:hypothetical protein